MKKMHILVMERKKIRNVVCNVIDQMQYNIGVIMIFCLSALKVVVAALRVLSSLEKILW